MRRSSQSGNQQPKQHLLSGLQCRKRLVADILFWDGKQWGNQSADELSHTFSFNVAFTQCFRVYATDNTGTAGSAFVAAILAFDANTCTVTTDTANRTLGAFSWLAIGR